MPHPQYIPKIERGVYDLYNFPPPSPNRAVEDCRGKKPEAIVWETG